MLCSQNGRTPGFCSWSPPFLHVPYFLTMALRRWLPICRADSPGPRLPSSTRMSHGTLELSGLRARPHADFPSAGPSSAGESSSHLGGQVAHSEAFSVSSRSSLLSSSHAVLPQDRTVYCLTPIRMGCYQNPEITGAGKDVEELEPVCAAGWECEETQPAWKGWQVLKKLNIDSWYDPAILPPSTNLEN